MRLVVDLQACQSGSRLGGIGRYSMDLLKNMIRVEPGIDYVILLNQLFPQSENEIRSALRNVISPSNFVTFPAPRGCASAYQNRALTQAAEVLRENFIASIAPDAVHVASLIEGFHDDVVASIGRGTSSLPTAVTFYDLIPLVESEKYLSSRIARAHYFEKIRSLSRADELLAISDFVAQEGRRLLPDFKGNISTIHGGIGAEFKRSAPDTYTAEIRRKFGLSRKFILYVASFDQRKNQANLIRAFALNKDRFQGEYQLALAGGGDPKVLAQFRDIAEKCGLDTDDVRLLGRVSDKELVALYSACSLFAFPPLSEGMGMPPLEAAACGAVVIGSATSSIPEVIGWENALFDPFDPRAIAEKMREALFDTEFRAESLRRAPAQIEKYSWTESATKALDALKAVARRVPARAYEINAVDDLRRKAFCEDLIEADLFEVSRCASIIEAQTQSAWRTTPARVGWVTSWGSRCGIADYSKHLIQELQTKPIVLASYRGTSSDPDLQTVRCWEEGKQDYLVELESAINDNDLNVIHIQFNFGFFDFVSFERLVFSLIGSGKSVFVTLHSTQDQFSEPTWRLSWIANALKACHRIFVHSIHDVHRLANLGIVEVVTLIPLGIVQHQGRNRNLRSGSVKIATYGFALPGKGLGEAVDAISLLLKESVDVELEMINADYQDHSGISSSIIAEIETKIDQHDLHGKIKTCFEFLEEAEVSRKLSDADIILFPYTKTGESGSAAVRAAMSLDKIIAISPLPIFDDIREAAVILPGTSAKDIADGLKRLICDMRNGCDSLKSLAIARRQLVDATSYQRVSQFLEQEMSKFSYWSPYSEIFRSGKNNLFVSDSVWKEDRLIASERGGVVCYGPYIDLWKGVYRLKVNATASTSVDSFDVTISSHAKPVISTKISINDGKIHGDMMFVIEEDLPLVEFIIHAPKKSEFCLLDYTLLKRLM